MNKLLLDFTRSDANGLLPYTQKEIISKLVADQRDGLDIFKKIEPRTAAETAVMKIEEDIKESSNTKLTFYRLDKDGDIDDTTLEIFYYSRINVNEANVKKVNAYPPVFGDNYDIPEGTKISNQLIAVALTDMFFVEFKEENISGEYTLTEKPVCSIDVQIVNHPIFTGTVTLVICSPTDARTVKTVKLGQIETKAGKNSVTVTEYRSTNIDRNLSATEMKLIRDGLRVSSYLGG